MGNQNATPLPACFQGKQLEKLVQVAFGESVTFEHSFISKEGSWFLK